MESWLIDELVRRDGAGLGRCLWEFGRLREVFAVSQTLIKVRSSFPHSLLSLTDSSVTQNAQSASSPIALPYSLFDSLLALEPSTAPELEGSELSSLQRELRSALDGRMKELESGLRSERGRVGR